MKVLVVRFSSIGDIVLTTPVIRCLKQQGNFEVHFLTKASFRKVLEANPYIDRLYSIQKEIIEVIDDLKQEQYDAVIDLHKNLRTYRLKMALDVESYAFDKLNWQKWLIVNLKINRLPNLHIVDRNLATIAPLHIQNDGQGLDYFIPKQEEVDLMDFFKKETPPPYLALVIGAAHQTKRLPTQKIIELCKKLKQPTVLLGGPSEAKEGEQIAEAAGHHIWNACGKLRLHQSASMVKQAALVITHDTGLMHIAAAFHKPIISIWGNTIPEFGMYPYYPKGINRNQSIEVKDLSCRPCSKIGYKKCPKKHFNCMQEIDLDQITSLVNQLEL